MSVIKFLAVLCFILNSSAAAEEKLTAEQLKFFESKIRPVLVDRCYKCHSKDSKKLKGNLYLDSKVGWEAGGNDFGPAIIPGNPEKSPLIFSLSHEHEDLEMPKKKMPQTEIDLLTKWVKMGAPDPRKGDKNLVENRKKLSILKAQKEYWAFKKLEKPALPEVKNKDWCKNSIDPFLLSRMEAKGLTPNDSVSKRKLIRRLYFDVIGLPPTPQEIESFISDKAPNAKQKLIDRLLASPHYGERWARHWMDVARFAESHGFEHDYTRPNAFYYRDFLIKAFNDDLPYDKFVQWQIAGDEIAPENHLAHMATGYLSSGVFPTVLTKAQFKQARYDELDDVVGTIGTSFLGLTVSCARCHNHKYDPIPQGDYYSMASTFASAIRVESHVKFPEGSPFINNDKVKNLLKAEQGKLKHLLTKQIPGKYKKWHKTNQNKISSFKLTPELTALIEKSFDSLNEKEKTTVLDWYLAKVESNFSKKKNDLLESVKKLEDAVKNNKAPVMVLTEGIKPMFHHANNMGYPHFYDKVHHLKRGSPSTPGEEAKPSFLKVLMSGGKTEEYWQKKAPEGARTPYRRYAMAKWLTDVEFGAGHLAARVMVNRLWQHHFGRGIVETPNDFGEQGYAPTHPQLLDFLAVKLIENNWSLKSIHRLILNSAGYQVSADHHASKQSIDPDNKLFWKRPLRRLDAEPIRDSMLAISNMLDTKMYGPSGKGPDFKGRSVYLFLKRSDLDSMMSLYDLPSPLSGQGNRQVTTIAPTALMMINSSQVDVYAQKFAERLANTDTKNSEIVNKGYHLALGRLPSAKEFKTAENFLSKADNRQQALVSFAKALMSLNEFVYVE